MKRCYPETYMCCHPNNPCSGKYGKCLDVKLTNECNAKCSFCVETGGYCPNQAIPAKKLATIIRSTDADEIMLLGGEPTLYSDMNELLNGCVHSKRVFMTTNGTMLTPEYVIKNDLSRLSGLNISIHHFTEEKNWRILKTRKPVSFFVLKAAIDHMTSPKVRINCNLIKGGVDNMDAIHGMILLAKYLRAQVIRFAELQNVDCDGGFVDARSIFPKLPKEPFTEGCEHGLELDDFNVVVRQTCGFVCPEKQKPVSVYGKNPRTQVLYNNGEIMDGWARTKKQVISESAACHESNKEGCHGKQQRKSQRTNDNCHRADGCH